MTYAIWNEMILADSEDTIFVMGVHYFPPHSLRPHYLCFSSKISDFPVIGTARYYSLSVNGRELPDAAWYHPNPKGEFDRLRNYVAFGPDVEMRDCPD